MAKSPTAFRTIGEVSTELGIPQHVLRYWEGRFPQVKPLQRAGNRRYYRPEDIQLLRQIQHLLDQQGYSIRGVQKLLEDKAERPIAPANMLPSIPQEPAQMPDHQRDALIAIRRILADALTAA
ncbi:MAG TPA: MerR family transcriptional regulator [Sphingomonas sp.]|jgi:DNA-binding transcriptional MerR regulator|uniref:MerR family transcriptional regulator n=1 Tax=Sphingomonas sp. TaxID=28214 RepID=UPI002EDA1941